MSSSIRVIRYEDRDCDQVSHLQTNLWHLDPELNAKILDWKYRQNPYRNSGIYLALDGELAVGMRGLFGTRWQCDGVVYDIPSAGDTVVAPEYRNRGLFKQIVDVAMAELAENAIPFAFNLSAGTVVHLMSRSLGWMAIGNLENLGRGRGVTTERATSWRNRLRRFNSAVRVVRWVRGLRRAMEDSSTIPFRYLDRALPSGRSDLVWSTSPRPEEMAQLVADTVTDGRIRHVRDVEYFAWRFGNPLKQYRFVYYGRTRLEGYMILAANRYGDQLEKVTIVDWEGRTLAVKEKLLDFVVSTGQLKLLTIWGACLEKDERQKLERHGFCRTQSTATLGSPFCTVLVGRTKADGSWLLGERNILDRENWDVRSLYSDGE